MSTAFTIEQVHEVTAIRSLRNDVEHNEPTDTLMNDAKRRMQAASLWSAEDNFIAQPLVQDVLRELGESSPATLLVDLLGDVRRRIIDS